jgi:hypothetical protein
VVEIMEDTMIRWLLAGIFTLALTGAPPEPADCVACHDQVDLEKFRTRTHGVLACTNCHVTIKSVPHAEKLPPVQCIRCHAHENQDYERSVHGVAQQKGKKHAATCRSCHGPAHEIVAKSNPASQVARRNMQATCGKCHSPEHLAKLSTHLSSRASRMDVHPFPK